MKTLVEEGVKFPKVGFEILAKMFIENANCTIISVINAVHF